MFYTHEPINCYKDPSSSKISYNTLIWLQPHTNNISSANDIINSAGLHLYKKLKVKTIKNAQNHHKDRCTAYNDEFAAYNMRST